MGILGEVYRVILIERRRELSVSEFVKFSFFELLTQLKKCQYKCALWVQNSDICM